MGVIVHLVRGQWGWTTSQGIDSLCLHLGHLPNVETHIWNRTEQQTIVAAIRGNHKPCAIIGFSLGATYAPGTAEACQKPVELIIGIDPSRWYLKPVPANVERAICFYNTNAWFYGGTQYSRAKDSHGYVENCGVVMAPGIFGHLSMDWNQQVWNRCEQEVKSLAA